MAEEAPPTDVYEPVAADEEDVLPTDIGAGLAGKRRIRKSGSSSVMTVWSVVKVLLAVFAVILLVLLGKECAEGGFSMIGASNGGTDAGRVPVRYQIDDSNTAHVRALTANYVKLRMANDLDGIKDLYAPDATLHIDLSKSKWVVAANVRTKCGTDFEGPLDILKYYHAYPAESHDVAPDPESFVCSGNTCTVEEKVHRFLVGDIQTKAVFTWAGNDRIKSMVLSLS
eukprot:CAMPEP_0117536914 /NCGR_PEP_ID=MMETSP0784-20121206/41696_1 /TAXON_ID=39447 /ORGANISM="" /LENGTH=226 /DNA_ID=CAMNT_0005333487 /DNA_START=146 /DNA_END=826 /DNA_ORIENTATION=+